MFARVSSVIALALCASASVLPRTDGCNTGSMQCCSQTQSANSPSVATLAGILGIVLPTVEGLVGVSCSPLSLVGLNSNSCSAQPVCCSNNNFNGVVALGCNPINLSL